MIKKLTSLSHKTLFLFLVIIIAIGAVFYVSANKAKPIATSGLPEYLNLGNSYVFKIPKNYSVDAQSVPGAELIYSTPITAKTVDDIYNQSGIAAQPLALTDHSPKAFKDYVNGTYLSDLKKNLSTNDVEVKFGKTNGSDNVKITVRKDGKQIRYIYLKGGQHPVAVLAKTETDNFKVIEQTINDVENSDLENETDGIKKSIQNNIQLAKDQKAQELYAGAAPALRAQITQDTLASGLKSASSYLAQNIAVSGGSYSAGEFSAALRFTPVGQDNPQPTFGAIALKKIDGQWKLQALSLPTPKQ
ncbi:hypothetical protein HYW35_02975 [Candidatus Saccharibacteria bacterium]|nr:hypothetical protein [Candidatus Saccharibacteria bacterium]